MVDINQQIAEQMRGGIDKAEYANGVGGRLSDPMVERMAYVTDRGLPWWAGTYRDTGQGTGLDRLQTAEEMIVAAGLDWDVEIDQIALVKSGAISAEKFATVRTSDGAWLGTVGRNYQIIQNREAFAFADALVDDGQAKYETAGSMRGGRVVCLSMELSHLDIKLEGEHPEGDVKLYLLLSNAHDGSRALECDITPIRWVCKNTLNLAIGNAQRRFKIRHSGSTDGKLQAARQALGIAFTYDKAFAEAANRLLDKKLVDEQVLEILQKSVWPIDIETATEGRIESHAATRAFENYLTSDNLAPIRGTAWGVLNAVAEFVDHEVDYRGRYDTDADVRANSILWGTAQYRKQRAFDALVKVKA